MYSLISKHTQEFALPAPCGAVVLAPGESKWVHDAHYAELAKSPFTQQALNRGWVEVEHSADIQELEPEPNIYMTEVEGGWNVFVHGECVTDEPVSKSKAKRIMAQYDV